MTTWLVILSVGVGSYALRALPVLLDLRVLRSPRVEQAIGHAVTAAIAALVMTGLRRSAEGDPVPTMVAAAAALWFAWRGGSMLRVLGGGGAAFALVLVASLAW